MEHINLALHHMIITFLRLLQNALVGKNKIQIQEFAE